MTSRPFSAFPEQGLKFLRALKRHNNRDWFQEHKGIYESAVKQPMQQLVEALASDFARIAPEMVADPRTSIYRIYRDTRFSKDKSPYKTHAAAVFPRNGLGKHQGAGFYIHIATDEVLIGGGVYMPLPEDLNEIRTHIADNLSDFTAIVRARAFRQMFGNVSGERLTRVPRGFSPEHPGGDYLRHKQFLAGRTLEPEDALRPQFYRTVIQTFQGMLPFVRFLNEPLVRARRGRDRREAMVRA